MKEFTVAASAETLGNNYGQLIEANTTVNFAGADFYKPKSDR